MTVYELLLRDHPKSLNKLDKWHFKEYKRHISIPTLKQKSNKLYPDDDAEIDRINKKMSQAPKHQKRIT